MVEDNGTLKFDDVDTAKTKAELRSLGIEHETLEGGGGTPHQSLLHWNRETYLIAYTYMLDHFASHDNLEEWASSDAKYEIDGWQELLAFMESQEE